MSGEMDSTSSAEEPIRALFADPSTYDLEWTLAGAAFARGGAAFGRALSLLHANPAFIPRNHRNSGKDGGRSRYSFLVQCLESARQNSRMARGEFAGMREFTG
jgi:hypothetical protein